jgi:hypothetical protein
VSKRSRVLQRSWGLWDRLILRQPLALLVGKAGLVQELPGGGGVAGHGAFHQGGGFQGVGQVFQCIGGDAVPELVAVAVAVVSVSQVPQHSSDAVADAEAAGKVPALFKLIN